MDFARNLRLIPLPASDADEIEAKFLEPVDEMAHSMKVRADELPRWDRSAGGNDLLDFRQQLSVMDFCVASGITPAPDWKVHATFDERLQRQA